MFFVHHLLWWSLVFRISNSSPSHLPLRDQNRASFDGRFSSRASVIGSKKVSKQSIPSATCVGIQHIWCTSCNRLVCSSSSLFHSERWMRKGWSCEIFKATLSIWKVGFFNFLWSTFRCEAKRTRRKLLCFRNSASENQNCCGDNFDSNYNVGCPSVWLRQSKLPKPLLSQLVASSRPGASIKPIITAQVVTTTKAVVVTSEMVNTTFFILYCRYINTTLFRQQSHFLRVGLEPCVSLLFLRLSKERTERKLHL